MLLVNGRYDEYFHTANKLATHALLEDHGHISPDRVTPDHSTKSHFVVSRLTYLTIENPPILIFLKVYIYIAVTNTN